MSNLERVNLLVETRINGNKIKGDVFYESVLKTVNKIDILEYGECYGIEMEEFKSLSKLLLIERISLNRFSRKLS